MTDVTDTRRYPRRSFVRRGAVQIAGPGRDEVVVVPGTFESLSHGGAGLSLDGDIPIAVGRGSAVELCLFSARSDGAPGARAARLPARVAWTRRFDGHLRLGAEVLVESLTRDAAEVMRCLLADEPFDDAPTVPMRAAAEGDR